MPTFEERINTEQQNFYEKYGVNFDIEGFETKSSFHDNLGGFGVNTLYRQAFIPLYKKAFANFIDGKIGDSFDVADMINDFEKIMEPYREKCNENKNVKAPDAFGGWTTKEFLEASYNGLKGVADDKLNYAARRYLERDLKIRDMRSFAEKLQEQESPSAKDLATLYCYAEGLSKVHEERGAFYKFIHPFQYRAEKREAKNFKNYLAQVTGGELKEGVGNEKFEEMLKHVNSDVIKNSRKTIKDAWKKAELEEENKKDQAEKEREANEPISEKVRKKLYSERHTYNQKFAVKVGNRLPENNMNIVAKVGSLEGAVGTMVINLMEAINKNYEDEVADGADPKEQMVQFVKDVWKPASKSLYAIGNYDQKDKLAITQLIVDQAMKELSPSAFNPKEFGEFANGYVLKNPEKFADVLKLDENPQMLEDAKKAYNDMIREKVKVNDGDLLSNKEVAKPVDNSVQKDPIQNIKN